MIAEIDVTSLAEVWIEIVFATDLQNCLRSLPLRKCGLKSPCNKAVLKLRMSLPLRKCGLKLSQLGELLSPPWSLPLRKCGLKY